MVHKWQLEWDSNLRFSGRKVPNLPLSHHAPQYDMALYAVVAEYRNALIVVLVLLDGFID